MITINQYLVASSLEEAYETLVANKKNVVLGGMLWLKMSKQAVHTAIDLSALGINQITETDEYIEIGCMTTLRQVETSPLMQQHFGGVVATCVKDIVGTQFRNSATIGGSVFGRYGFSDVLTALLALDTYVELHKGGVMPLEDFIKAKRNKDILVKVMIRKNGMRASYHMHRNSATDFPVLAVAVSYGDEGVRISVGARPHKAKRAYEAEALLKEGLTDETIEKAAKKVTEELDFGSNLRAGEAYRKVLAQVFVKRAIDEIRA